jgi:hypothetical protein
MGEEPRVANSTNASAAFSGGPVRRGSTMGTEQSNRQEQSSFGKRREPHGLYIISAAFLIFAGIAVAMALPPFWRQYRVLSAWPEVNAQVVRSDVVQLTFAGNKYYAWDLQLLFTRDGSPHFGSAAPRQSRDYQEVRRASDEFPVGSYHNVRVNPANPQEIRLHAGWNRRFFAVPILLGGVAGVFGAIALALFFLVRAQSADID